MLLLPGIEFALLCSFIEAIAALITASMFISLLDFWLGLAIGILGLLMMAVCYNNKRKRKKNIRKESAERLYLRTISAKLTHRNVSFC